MTETQCKTGALLRYGCWGSENPGATSIMMFTKMGILHSFDEKKKIRHAVKPNNPAKSIFRRLIVDIFFFAAGITKIALGTGFSLGSCIILTQDRVVQYV